MGTEAIIALISLFTKFGPTVFAEVFNLIRGNKEGFTPEQIEQLHSLVKDPNSYFQK